MTVKYEYLVDGTKFAAVEYNTRFEPVFSWINSLTPESLSLGAFRQEHLPCLVGPAGVGEGKLTADWDGTAPLSNGYTALNNVSHGAGPSASTLILSTHGFDWTGGVFAYDAILRCAWDADDPTMASPVALSQDVDLRGRVGALFLMGNFTVQRWMLIDSSGGFSAPTVGDLNEDVLAVSAAFVIYYTPRNADGTSAGPDQTVVLQKSQRSLSPRLTIGWADYVNSLQEVVTNFDVVDSAERALFISSAFNTASSPQVLIGDNLLPSALIRVDLESTLPELWTRLNTSTQNLYLTIAAPDNDGFRLDQAGEAAVALGPPGFPLYGTPIDKQATLDLHAAGTVNGLVMEKDFVSATLTPHWDGLNDTDADPEDFRWTVWSGSAGAGVPLADDIYTNQDLALRTVLLPEDLPLVGGATYAEVNQVAMVATQDGVMAELGKYVVLTTNANLSVLPLHVKLVT